MEPKPEKFSYKVGDYVDFLHHGINWAYRIVDEQISANTIRVVDPGSKYKFQEETVLIDNFKLKPFRTETKLLNKNIHSSWSSNNKTFNMELYQKNLKDLQTFQEDLLAQSPKEIIQFLRGRHLIFMSQFNSFNDINSDQKKLCIENYIKKHLKLMIKYFQTANFKDLEVKNIYETKMTALCSSFPQLIYCTSLSLGISENYMGRDGGKFINRQFYEKIREEWIQNEFLPSLLQMKIDFSIEVVLGILDIFLNLYKKNMINKTEPLSSLIEMLYKNFLDLLRTKNLSRGQMNYFNNNIEHIFKLFNIQELNDNQFDNSQITAKIDSQDDKQKMDIEEKMEGQKQKNEENQKSEKTKNKVDFEDMPITLTQDKIDNFVRMKKIEYRFFVIQIMQQKKNYEQFCRELSLTIAFVSKQQELFSQDKRPRKEFFNYFITKIQQNNYLSDYLLNNTNTIENMKQTVIRIYMLMPKQTLQLLVHCKKENVIKFVLPKINEEELELVVNQMGKMEHTKQKLQLHATLEKWLSSSIYTNNLKDKEFIKDVRNILWSKLYQMTDKIPKDLSMQQITFQTQFLTSFNIGQTFKYELFCKHVQKNILPKISVPSHELNLLEEIMLSKYCIKRQVDLATFSNLILSIGQVNDIRFEKRKNCIFGQLYGIFRKSREIYLQYLEVLIEDYHMRKKMKKKNWRKLQFFSKLSNDDQYQENYFINIKNENLYERILYRIFPVETQQQLNLFQQLAKALRYQNQENKAYQQNYQQIYNSFSYSNIKILYIIHKDGILNKTQREYALECMKNDLQILERYREEHELVKVYYNGLKKLIYREIFQKFQDSFQFCMELSNIDNLSENQHAIGLFKEFWKHSFQKTDYQKKKLYFQNFEKNIDERPSIYKEFPDILYKMVIKKSQRELYLSLSEKSITMLIYYKQKFEISQNQYEKINILIKIIATIRRLGVEDKGIYNQDFVDFVFGRIYDCMIVDREDFYFIVKCVMQDDGNRKKFINFFQSQIRQKQWQAKSYLQKPKRKFYQQQNLIGLKNPHSICYVNSFLQQLYHINIFRQNLLLTSWTKSDVKQEDLMYQLKKIFVLLKQKRQPVMNFEFFKAFKNIQGEQTSVYIQMDVDEFKNVLLDRIQQLLPKGNNFIQNIFNGKQLSIIKSQECEHVSQKQEQFSSLCLNIKDNNQINSSIKSYFKPQILEGDNAYLCEECKKKVKAERIIEIKQYPMFLTFVLKRFQYNYHRRVKLNNHFSFPLESFSPFPGTNYKLKGIIVHMGISQAGHYFSFIKHNNLWYEFNDSSVSQVDEKYVIESSFGQDSEKLSYGYCSAVNKNAYLLIYENMDIEKTWRNDEYYGVDSEIKQIRKQMSLNQKEKFYFDSNFLSSLLELCQETDDIQCDRFLLNVLIGIFFKINDNNHTFALVSQSLKYIKNNKERFDFISGSADIIAKSMQFFETPNLNRFKHVLADIIIDHLTVTQQFLDQILLKFHNINRDFSIYYKLLLRICQVNKEALEYLNEKRILGRILDVVLTGTIGGIVRDQLKKSTNLTFEKIQNFKVKQIQKSQYKYHKWNLLLFLADKLFDNLTETQKKYFLFASQSVNFKVIFEDCSTKTVINKVSKWFCFLCSKNPEYEKTLFTYLHETMVKQRSDELRKYWKVVKDLIMIKDENKFQRVKKGVNLFFTCLRRFHDERIDSPFDISWQWLLIIAHEDQLFQERLIEHASCFNFFDKILNNHIFIYRMKESFKIDKMKSRVYGLKFAKDHKSLTSLLTKRVERTRLILSQKLTPHQKIQWPIIDQDITDEKLQPNYKAIKYNEQTERFENIKITFTIGDLIFFKVYEIVQDQLIQNKSSHAEKGSEKLSKQADLNRFYAEQYEESILSENQSSSNIY